MLETLPRADAIDRKTAMTQRKIMITGAGSGLGRALALRYAKAGCAVACVDIVLERAQETVALLQGAGHMAFVVDVGNDASFDALHAAIDAQFGALDVLVNNAGIASGGPMVDTTMAEWREVLEINLLGVVRGCRAFLPGMLERGRGRILNTASFAGLAGAPSIMTYGVAKAGVVALSEQLRAELHGTGVSVSVACPAFFQTNLLQNWRGSARMKGFAEKMMKAGADTLDAVADNIFAAAERGDFLILPTRNEPIRWRIKRWFPEFYFRRLTRAVAAMARKTA
jgi:NAD(P)-dependent dehydrogenase (short-subunit alcohol dehydrogenase family)